MKILWKTEQWKFPSVQFDLKMKLTTLLLFIVLFGLRANDSYSQKTRVTLDATNISVASIIDDIEANTEYRFVYNLKSVDVDRKVSIKVKQERIERVLAMLFRDTNTQYHVKDKQVILSASTFIDRSENNGASVLQDPIKVNGQVTDVNGVPLIGVNVVIKGTTLGTATDFDGNYSIVVPNSQSVLVFSSTGYTGQELTVGNRTIIDVKLDEAVSQLDEVVLNAGYYQVKKRETTGNISSIEAAGIAQQQAVNPLEAIQGQLAGVNIIPRSGIPGGAIEIEIRGRNSLRNEGNNVLYVIDGVPYPSNALQNGGEVGSQILYGSNPLSFINPNDIASIDVLKDADATAIYGSLGANGVVLITTKKGTAGNTSVSLNMSKAFGSVAKKINVLNTEQYLRMRIDGIENSGFGSFLEDPAFDSFWPAVKLWDPSRNTDWQDELIGGTAERTNLDLSVNWGNENTQFNVGASYQNETTVFPSDDGFKRYSGLLNLTHRSNDDRFRLLTSINLSNTENTLPSIDLTRDAVITPPNAPDLFDENGNVNWEDSFQNPIASLKAEYSDRTTNIIANLNVEYEVLKNLKIRSSFGYNQQQLYATQINPLETIAPDFRSFTERSSRFRDGSFRSWIIEPQLEYTARIDKLSIIGLVGSTFRSDLRESKEFLAEGFSNDAFLLDINASESIDVRESSYTQYRYNAIFARINLDWSGKYFLNLTGRRDGSSRFGPNKRFGNFGAVGAAWLFSNEDFIKESFGFLSTGKLRGSYGTTGNDQIGDYGYLDTYTFTNQPYNGVVGLDVQRLANPNFSWETVKKFEVGLELGFFRNRVFSTFSWYQNRAEDQLVGFPLSTVTGSSSLPFNLPAIVDNRGWEFTLNTTNFQSQNFSWTSYFNLSIPRNELVAFPDIENYPSYDNKWVIGESINGNSNLMYEYLGVDPETGLYEFTDFDGDGQISFPNDLQKYVEMGQEYFGGLNNKIQYKGIEVSFLFQFVKQKTRNFYNIFNFEGPGGYGNVPVEVFDNWKEPGDESNFIKSDFFNAETRNSFLRYTQSDGSVANTSFIRLNNLSVSYNLPTQVTDHLRMQSLRIYAQGQNLWTITDFKGLSPFGGGLGLNLPPLRYISLGLQARF